MSATQGRGTIRLHSVYNSALSMDYAIYFLPPGEWLPNYRFLMTFQRGIFSCWTESPEVMVSAASIISKAVESGRKVPSCISLKQAKIFAYKLVYASRLYVSTERSPGLMWWPRVLLSDMLNLMDVDLAAIVNSPVFKEWVPRFLMSTFRNGSIKALTSSTTQLPSLTSASTPTYLFCMRRTEGRDPALFRALRLWHQATSPPKGGHSLPCRWQHMVAILFESLLSLTSLIQVLHLWPGLRLSPFQVSDFGASTHLTSGSPHESTTKVGQGCKSGPCPPVWARAFPILQSPNTAPGPFVWEEPCEETVDVQIWFWGIGLAPGRHTSALPPNPEISKLQWNLMRL